MCENKLFISHDNAEKMIELIEAIKKGEFLRYLAPIEDDVKGTIYEHEWKIENWGCDPDILPENVCDCINRFSNGDLDIRFYFLSFANPPTYALQAGLSKGFQSFLTYDDPVGGYMGAVINGVEYDCEYCGKLCQNYKSDKGGLYAELV